MAHCETGACNDNRIRDNSVTNVFNGIQLTNNVHGNVVDHNESFGNGRGFRQFSDDPSTMPTDSSVVRHNKFHDNTEQGISLSATSGNTIHHNETNNNTLNGVRLGGGASGNLVNENVADGNGQDGIRAESAAGLNTIQSTMRTTTPRVPERQAPRIPGKTISATPASPAGSARIRTPRSAFDEGGRRGTTPSFRSSSEWCHPSRRNPVEIGDPSDLPRRHARGLRNVP
jgi:parallel beta-helix repeat protein